MHTDKVGDGGALRLGCILFLLIHGDSLGPQGAGKHLGSLLGHFHSQTPRVPSGRHPCMTGFLETRSMAREILLKINFSLDWEIINSFPAHLFQYPCQR